MKIRLAVFLALAVAVTLTSVAESRPDAAKQRVAIEMKILPNATFVLTPLQAGAMKRDSGTVTEGKTLSERNGITTGLWTFTGKRGNLVLRERREWVQIGNDGNGDGYDDAVAFGTWRFVRGTGQYVRVAGGGRSGHEGLGRVWSARLEGFLTGPTG
jgi:hypothetical protein